MNRKIHIHGKCRALFKRGKELSSGSYSQLSDIKALHDCRVFQIEKTKAVPVKQLIVGKNYLYFPVIPNAELEFNGVLYSEDIKEVVILNPEIKAFPSGEIWDGELTGEIYCYIEEYDEANTGAKAAGSSSGSKRKSFSEGGGNAAPANNNKNNNAGSAPPKDTNENGGCISKLFKIIGWLLLAAFIISMISLLISFPSFFKILLAILGVVVLILLFYILADFVQSIFAVIIMLILGFLLLSWLFSSFSSKEREEQEIVKEDDPYEWNEVIRDSLKNANDPSDSLFTIHHRKWNDFNARNFEGDIVVSQKAYFSTLQAHHHLNITRNDFLGTYNQVYGKLASLDYLNLKYLYRMFDSLQAVHRLNRNAFADMVVTCIQDIPYRFIADVDCKTFAIQNPQYAIELANKGCLGNVPYGVQSPVEYMYNLYGDCDTRALLLFTVFSHYKYDVAVLTSHTYRHSMLGINLPSTGAYLKHSGKKFYFWETTTTNMMLGALPAECNNTGYWDVCLVKRQ